MVILKKLSHKKCMLYTSEYDNKKVCTIILAHGDLKKNYHVC